MRETKRLRSQTAREAREGSVAAVGTPPDRDRVLLYTKYGDFASWIIANQISWYA